MASEPTTDPTDERPGDEHPIEPGRSDPGSPAVDTPADSGTGEQTPPAAATRTPRKRAASSRSKKAAPPAEPTTDDGSGTGSASVDTDGADGAGGASSARDTPAPAKRARSRRATAASRSAESAPEAVERASHEEVEPEQQAAHSGSSPDEVLTPGEAVIDEVAARDVELDDAGHEGTELEATELEATAADDGIADENDAEDAEGGPVAQVPSFGLLFQAPEPVAPRRRRATAAAGAPPPAVNETPRARVEDAPEEPEPVRGEEADADLAEGREESAEDADGTARRSRRRGGRGRRPRGSDAEPDAGDAQETGGGQVSADQGEDDEERRPARRGRRRPTSDAGAAAEDEGPAEQDESPDGDDGSGEGGASSRRRRRRRRGPDSDTEETRGARARDEVTALKGSTRLEAKKQRRREGREAGRRRTIITEAEFLARRESVERVMLVRERDNKTQIAVLEDGVLVEHYVSRESGASMIGNVYLGRVQNVLPSMEAAFVDIGKGRNAVLYAGEVNWDAAGLEGNVPKRIENALGSGDTVLTQVTKDPIGHKGARLTSQVSLPGRFLVYVPEASMTGISRKLPDTERARLKSILKRIVPDDAGVIVRTAAEGASEEELTADITRLTKAWERIQSKAESAAKKKGAAGAPLLLHGEPDLTVKVIRDVFNEDFSSLVVSGETAWAEVSEYLEDVAPELAKRLSKWTGETDIFAQYRVDEQIAKALDRKVWLPSGGSLVIDRTEAMTVIDVNTGKFVGSGGNLEETVTKNNIEAAEEIVRQLRLRDIGGIIVVDFIDMVLESNRDLVVRRLLECLGRDRTKHQVAEVTSLGLVQMTRKRVGSGLLEVFSEPCAHCAGRGVIVHSDPVDEPTGEDSGNGGRTRGRGRGAGNGGGQSGGAQQSGGRGGARGNGAHATTETDRPQPTGPTAAQIAAAAHAAALKANASAAVADEPATGDEVTGGDLSEVAPATDLADPDVATDAEVATDPDVTDHPEAATERDVAREPAVATDTDLAGPPRESMPSHTESDGGQESTGPAAGPDVTPSTGRPRRKRGRVVAPAGPPGRSEARVITPGEG